SENMGSLFSKSDKEGKWRDAVVVSGFPHDWDAALLTHYLKDTVQLRCFSTENVARSPVDHHEWGAPQGFALLSFVDSVNARAARHMINKKMCEGIKLSAHFFFLQSFYHSMNSTAETKEARGN
ncbi:hypothetical protein PENTCL1PPCAC_24208, partial [Pristionchus entomophagus]